MTTIVEKELKILEIDPQKVQERLQELGATKSFEGEVYDVYYDTQEMSLAGQKKRIRIRQKGAYFLVTLKERIKNRDVKSAHETEIIIDNQEELDGMLRSYGLLPLWEKRKHRISYTYKSVTFDIDLYGHFPPILEIEGLTKKTINKRIRKLGLQKKTIATFGAHGLFKHYNLLPTKLVQSELVEKQ